jgi:hypothetical protein
VLEPRYVEFSQPQSFGDTATLCVELALEFKELADSLGLPDQDARSVALRNASHLAGAATMILNVLDVGTRSSEDDVRALLGLVDGSTQVAADDLEKFARIGLVTLVQFQVENLVANLVRALGPMPRRAYSRLVDQVLELTVLSKRRARTALLIPSWIRNTLHNNGIHEGPEARVQMHGYSFRFRNGRPFSQAGWGEFVHALRAELRTLERILSSPRVERISAPVVDRYAAVVRRGV